MIQSAHDVSEGGLFVSLLESSINGNLGFDITTSSEIRKDAFLFGESQSRVAISVSEIDEDKFLDFMKKNILILGGSGFIGSEILGDLKKFGTVLVTNRSNNYQLYPTAMQ